MRSRLHQITDWPGKAQKARYSVSRLARSCGVGLRQLERFFIAAKGISPKAWIEKRRAGRAVELLKDTGSVKQVAVELGYRTTAHFSHEFKKRHGISPTKFINGSPLKPRRRT